MYEFRVKSGLTYNDGTPITAKDYVFSILMQSSPAIAAIGGDTSGRIVRRLEAFVQSPSLGKPKLFYDGPVPGWEKEGSR